MSMEPDGPQPADPESFAYPPPALPYPAPADPFAGEATPFDPPAAPPSQPPGWGPPPPPPADPLAGEATPFDPPAAPPSQPPGWGPPPPPPAARRRHRLLALTAAVVLVVSGTGAYVVVGKKSHRSAAVIVADAVKNTMSRKMAAVILSGTETISGQSLEVTGSGVIDFPDNSLDLNLYLTAQDQTLPLQVIYTGGSIYETIPGVTDHVVPGKSWVSIDLKSVLGNGTRSDGLYGSANPAEVLPFYVGKDNIVRLLGPSPDVNSAVKTYSVTVTPAGYQRQLALLPAAARQALSGVAFNHLPTEISVDSSGLMEQARIRFDVGSTFAVDETLRFSDFGVSSVIAPPSPNETLSLQQLLGASLNESLAALRTQLLTPADIGPGTRVLPPRPLQGRGRASTLSPSLI
jgi:hypothetical protein